MKSKQAVHVAMALMMSAGASSASEFICEGVASRDAHARENPALMMKQGERRSDFGWYVVDEKGQDWYCARDNCFEAHIVAGGAKVEGVRLTNCRIGAAAWGADPKNPVKSYDLDRLAAGDPATALTFQQVGKRLDGMGLCDDCYDNARESYMRDPQSPCGQLVGKAMAGDAQARNTLAKKFPDYCRLPGAEPELQPPALGPNAKAPAAFAGRYVGGDRHYSQELTITKRKDGSFDIDALVGTPGCTGSMDARGAADGDLLKAQAKSEGSSCVFEIRRTLKGVRVDADACMDFHGASCEFTGDYRKKH
ncbi:hypothetical protein [Methylocystis parvus]|uniref:hypothetical protein n=1 Tax=Methylocystis parvus TaxID=134 RepID=UPI003C78E58F